MTSKLKEDEKNEKIIRGLLKKSGNRKCINCNVLGPQYVCITFSTFICPTCSGIHREFTHRVKSVSMAKFTPEEIASLQAGGNERAKGIFFKDLDRERLKSPDNSNVDKLRNFIKHVYVDRRYTGERSTDRPPTGKMGDKEEPNEKRRSDPYQSGSQRPPFDDELRYSDRPSPGHDVRKSPGFDQDNQRHSHHGRSPNPSGIVCNWRREDRFSNGKKSDDGRSSDGDNKPEIRSPDRQNDSSISSLPAVLPVTDLLGENVQPLQIREPPRDSSSRVAEECTVITQRTASSCSLAASSVNPTEHKSEISLIDFDASPEPAVTAAVTEVQQTVTDQSVAPSTSTPSDDDWGIFGSVQTPCVTNQLESVSGITSGGGAPTLSNGTFPSSSGSEFLFDHVGGTSMISPYGSLSPLPSGGVAADPNLALTTPVNGGAAQWHNMQSPQQPPYVAVNQPAAPQLVSAFPSGLSSQGVTVAQAPHALHTVPQTLQTIPAPPAQTLEANAKRSQELPMDFFAATYSTVPYPGPAWQTGQVPGMGFPMQYNTAMSTPTFPQPIKPPNPFDANGEASPSQAAAFPSMTSMHVALPNMAVHGGSVYASSLGGARPYTPSYPSAVPPHGSPAIPGVYMGQQLHSNMPSSRPQGFGSYGSEGTHFGSLNPAAATLNPSLGGNPFG